MKVLLALLVGLSSTCIFGAETPPAARGLLLDAAVAGHDVIAVGERGAIIRSADSGRTWEQLPTPTSATLTGIAFADQERGWAVGHDGVILYTRDGGLSWKQQYSDTSLALLDVAAVDIRRAFAIGAFGAFYSTEDGGNTWTPRHIISEDLHLNRATAAPGGIFFIAGERGTLLRSPHNGQTFLPIPTDYEGSFFGVLPLGGDALLAYGLRGRVYRSEGAAISWKAVALEHPALIATAVKLSSGTIVLAGQARMFFVSKDGGRTFHSWATPLTTAVAELIEAPDGSLLAFGEGGATRLPTPE